MDLTRAGDLIRARTLDAFFPLFAIAAVYFVVCRILFRIIRLLTGRIETRKRTVKGVVL